jgi:hypothetical protein
MIFSVPLADRDTGFGQKSGVSGSIAYTGRYMDQREMAMAR